MIPVLLVHGTWSADFSRKGRSQWFEPGSPFITMLERRGLDASYFDTFEWTGDLSGLARLWPWNWFTTPQHRDWLACGRSIGYVLDPKGCPVPHEYRNVIAHSHGGQGVFHAAANGVKIHRLVTVATPVREDMEAVVAAARPNIDQWVHVFDPTLKDRMQVLGEIGDGRLGWKRRFDLADENISIAGSGHSGVLCQPEWFPQWGSRGLAAFLRGDQQQAAA